MTEELRKSDPCDDVTYAKQYAKAQYTRSISKFLVRERISSDPGYEFCEIGIESLEKLMNPIDNRESNALVFGANTFAIAAAYKQDRLEGDGDKLECFEPICVLGLRIARELILHKDDDKTRSTSNARYDTLLAITTRLDKSPGNLCDETNLRGLLKTWKSMASMEN